MMGVDTSRGRHDKGKQAQGATNPPTTEDDVDTTPTTPPHIHDHPSHLFLLTNRPTSIITAWGSTMTGRQSTFCSPHISRCKADIGYAQSTKHTIVTTQQVLSAAKRRSATPHSTEMGHTPTMNTSRQGATHTLVGGHTERADNKPEHEPLKGGRTRRRTE